MQGQVGLVGRGIAAVLAVGIWTLASADVAAAQSQCSTSECEFCIETIGNLRIQRVPSRQDGLCMMKIDSGLSGQARRSFVLNSRGELQVFHDNGKKDAAQVSFLFPQGVNPRVLNVGGDGRVNILMGNGRRITFDSKTALPIEVEGCQIQVKSVSTMSDPGFQVGPCQLPIAKTDFIYDPKMRGKKVQLISSSNRSCEVDSSELIQVGKDEAVLRFKTNPQLKQGMERIVQKNFQCQSLGFDFSQFVDPISNVVPTAKSSDVDPIGELIKDKGLLKSQGAQ
jgi:hypothetical protein